MMKKTILFFCWVTSVGLLIPDTAAFDIVRNGKSAACLILPEKMPREVVDAVRGFQDDLKNLTGASIPAREVPGHNRIEVSYIKTDLAGDDTVKVMFPSSKVMRIESGKHGLIRIFPLLLERFGGVRYVYPTEKGTHYPAATGFTIPEKPFTHKPFFTYNRYFTWDYVPWQSRLGRKAGVKCDHDIPFYVIPIRQYIQSGKWPDGTVFPVLKGKRLDMKANPDTARFGSHFQSDWQPCFTSRASIDEAVKNIEAHLAAHPNLTSVSLTPNDGTGYCECENCAKLDRRKTPFRAYARYKDHANSYYHWCNEIIKRVVKKHPDLLFGTIAYRETHFVPDFKIHPNMLIYVCIDFGWGLYPDVMRKLKRDIEQFSRVGAKVGVWEYNWGEVSYSLPHYYPEKVAEMVRLLAANHYRAVFSEGNESLGEGPKRYLYLKLLENPDADLQTLQREWFEACVGVKAAPYLKEYFDFWEVFWRERASKTAHAENRNGLYQSNGNLFGSYMNGLRKGDTEKLRKLMDKTVSLAESHGDARQKIRARWLKDAFELYACQITLSAGELLPDSGAVENAELAAELLKNLPAMVEADKKMNRLIRRLAADPDLKWWNGIRRLAKRDMSRRYEYVPGKCLTFASDPGVYVELRKIVKNKSLPRELRLVVNSISKSGETKMKNLLEDSPAGRSMLKAEKIVLPVPNGEWLHDVPLAPARYMVSARLSFSPETEIPADAWINLRLQGRNVLGKAAGGILDSSKIRPVPGKKYALSNIYTMKPNADRLQIILNLFNFKPGTEVKVSDFRLIRMEQTKTPSQKPEPGLE